MWQLIDIKSFIQTMYLLFGLYISLYFFKVMHKTFEVIGL